MAQADPKIIQDEEEFLNDVGAFNEQRGISFDRDARASGRAIPLHKLYKIVMDRGGYDALSRERMQWRSLVKFFGFSSQHEAAMTFQLKTLYYKNLAAYEIAKYWGEIPPPREILEDLTAKGGELRSRTLETFPTPNAARTSGAMPDGSENGEEEDKTTPNERTETEDPGSASRYPTRLLRQEPKKTQIYQPDTTPQRARYSRTTSSPPPPQIIQPPYANASSDPRNPAFDIMKYEPRPPISLALRPVLTPGVNPDVFYQRKAIEKAQSMPRLQPEPQQFLKGIVPTMGGPNIYLRCLYGLRSGIEAEQDFALHHLVKVSFERGDKYKFEGFPLLAESLLEKALEVMPMVYGVHWEVSYDDEEGLMNENTINGTFGTPDLLSRLQQLQSHVQPEELASDKDAQKLEKLNEAALVVRNMVILEENAVFLSKFALFRDFLTIAISLPDQARLVEYKHYALEMAEQVTRYWHMAPDDPLYLSMLPYLASNDRALLLSSLRAINRIGIETPETHIITDVDLSSLERMVAISHLETDDELLEAVLDFLYEYTAIPENNKLVLATKPDMYPNLTPRLAKLLLYNATPQDEKLFGRPTQQKIPTAAGIPAIPTDLHQQLLQFQEPDRSSRWLRCCFEESAQDDITQIAIWQAYQGRFSQNNPIPAADFIKNVSNTFSSAQAQVINGPQPRFIIKGIRPRRILQDTQGRTYFKCYWENTRPDPFDPAARHTQRHLCSQWQSTKEKLWIHLLQDHLGVPRKPEGSFINNASGQYNCRWTGCSMVAPFTKAGDIALHMRSHVPESLDLMSSMINEFSGLGKEKVPEMTIHRSYHTPVDETRHAMGIPFMSVMVMRNLARYANKHGASLERDKSKLVDQLFKGVMDELWHVVSVNKTLRDWLWDLLKSIEKGEIDAKRGVKREREVEDTAMV